ncbi:hypothetical protein SH661x_003885 [Planctomicrobium sp. SH661]|uniref:hypothetical protein n=1 Tax=Planctomicrobium sp. SH661 TaxID=3448124 RepID=UPI003F5B31B9
MADDNVIIYKVENSQLLQKSKENVAAMQSLDEQLKEGLKTAKEVAKEKKAILAEETKIQKELDRREKEARKQREREAKEALAAEKQRQKELSETRKAANAEEVALGKKAQAEYARLVAAQEKLLAPAQAYLAKLKEWKAALEANKLTQQQFDQLRDSELQKVNAIAQAEKKAAAELAAAEAQKKKVIQERLKFEQHAAAERAAIAKRDKEAADAQKQKNIDSLKVIHKIREMDTAAAEARKKAAKESEAAKIRENKLKQDAIRLSRDLESAEEKRDRQLQRAKNHLDSNRIGAEKYAAAVKKINHEYEAAQQEVSGFAQSAASAMMGVAQGAVGAIAGTVSLTAAVAALRAEYEKVIEAQEKVRQTAVGFQNSMESLRMNFEPDETVGWQNLDEEVLKLAKSQNVSVNTAAQVLGSAFSAKGNRTNSWAFQAAGDSLSIVKNPTAAAALASASGDIAKFGESQDPQAIQGFVKQAQLASRIETVEGMGNAIPAISAGKELGMTAERSSELWIALGNLMNDQEGRISSSAFVNLSANLGDKFKLTSDQEKDKDLANQFKAFHALPMDESRIEFLRGNAKLREAWILNNPGEAKAGPAIRSMLNNDRKWQEEIQKVESVVPSLAAENDPANRKFFQESARQVQAVHTPAGAIAQAERQSDTNVEQHKLRSTDIEGRLAAMRKITADTLSEMDLKGPDALWQTLEKTSRGLGEMFGKDNPEDVIFQAFNNLDGLIQDKDLPLFNQQKELMKAERDAIAQARRENQNRVAPVTVDPLDTRSRFGKPLTELNERGAYQGTVTEVGAAVNTLATEVKGLRADLKQQNEKSIQNNQRNTDRLIDTTRQNKPPVPAKSSPMEKWNRSN